MSMADRFRRGTRRGTAVVAEHLPADRGPGHWRTFVGRAKLAEGRRALLADRDPRRALSVAEHLVSVPALAVQAWSLVAEAREALGQGRDALEAARRSTGVEGDGASESAPDPDASSQVAALLVHLRLARRYGEPHEVADVQRRLVRAAPAAPAELHHVVGALRESDLRTVDDLADHLRAAGARDWERSLDEVRAEVSVATAAPASLDKTIAETFSRLESPLPVLIRALTTRRDWDRVVRTAQGGPTPRCPETARMAAAQEKPGNTAEEALETRRAAAAALKAGRAGDATALARRSLELRPDDHYARQTLTKAEDQLALATHGWQPISTGPSQPPHQPRPRAILSVLAQSLPIRTGGYATRSHGILTGLVSHGWDVEAVTRLGFPYDQWPAGDARTVTDHDTVDGLTYWRALEQGRRTYPQHPLSDYVTRYAEILEAGARRHGAALLHASSFHVNGLATREVARRLCVPYVYEMRGLEDLMHVSRDPAFAGTDRDRFLHEVELASCAEAERVLVITKALKQEMVVRGVPSHKIVVLPNGVHASRFEPRPRDSALEARLGLGDRTVIGYAGSLVDYEGLDLLLEAVALVTTTRDDVRVVIVGDGAHADEVRRTATRLGLDDVVTFTGRVPHDEVARYLSLFDIAPFPRLPLPVCEMISPIKPFESMASGLAPVVSSVAALTEIVQHEHTGLVFEKGSATALAEALTRLVNEPDLRRRLGDNARDWVRAERDWSSIVGIVDGVYRDVLG